MRFYRRDHWKSRRPRIHPQVWHLSATGESAMRSTGAYILRPQRVVISPKNDRQAIGSPPRVFIEGHLLTLCHLLSDHDSLNQLLYVLFMIRSIASVGSELVSRHRETSRGGSGTFASRSAHLPQTPPMVRTFCAPHLAQVPESSHAKAAGEPL